jgi:leucyl aminopeptidase
MEFVTTTGTASRRTGGCIIVGVYEKGNPGIAAQDIDAASNGLISSHIKNGLISGRLGSTMLLPDVAGVRAQNVLVVGLGALNGFGVTQFKQATASAVNLIKSSKIREVFNYLTLEDVKGTSAYYLARHAVETTGNCFYAFHDMKSGKKPPAKSLNKIGLAANSRTEATHLKLGAEHGHAIVDGSNLARDLGNLPPNVCTPSYLARAAQKLGREQRNLKVKVLGETEIKRLGMHSFLSVTNGTVEPAKLIVMQYHGAAKQKPVVLVGKGITFDSGGISLKPGPGMDEMKFDMCGAASVIGAMSAVAALKLPINLTVVVPTCENLPSGTATRPGDIVSSMSGKTIEVLNTDAEGRLILCDALTYSRRFKPDVIIDVATLTGACVIALGHHRTAIMSHHDELADDIAKAGVAADDQAWQLPLGPEYEKQLKSNFADLANVGGRDGGAITAGCFLSKFTEGLNWAHLDIAGTAWRAGSRKGSTGRPVPMLTEFLLQRSGTQP